MYFLSFYLMCKIILSETYIWIHYHEWQCIFNFWLFSLRNCMSYDVSANILDHPKEKDWRPFYYHYFYGTTYPMSLFSLFHSLQTLSTANCQYIPWCMWHVYHCLLLLFEIQSKTSTIGRDLYRFIRPVILMKSFWDTVFWTWDTPAPSTQHPSTELYPTTHTPYPRLDPKVTLKSLYILIEKWVTYWFSGNLSIFEWFQ